KVRGTIRDDIDGRTLGARIRKLARTSMNDLTVKFACEAVKSGIPASIIAFDSWFAVPHTISRLMKEANLTVIARLKTNSKQHYEYDGKMINIKALYTMGQKRRGKASWKLSVTVNLLVKEQNKIIERIPVKLVYLPNRANTKEWICILSTDTEMEENEIIRQYGKRWNIECMFKCSKQYLKFGKDFQSPSFESQNAQVAIAFTRYMMIAIEQRESKDYRSCGELFMLFYKELQDITFIQSLSIIVTLFKEGMKNLLGVTEEQIQTVVDYVVSALPGYLQRSLSLANGLSEAA
ncbi:MAG: transposase, partial [Blautia sp.]|nr:transposase [Blautia sp.]